MVNKNIQISVIIINFNAFNLLRDCLVSLFEKNREINFEVIIVDNASTEGNIDEVINDFQDIILLRNKSNLGFAAANNQASKIAKGEYLLFLNNDTLFLESSIKVILEYSQSLKQKVIVGCEVLNPDFTHQDSVFSFENISNVFGEKFFLYKLFKKNKIFNRGFYNYINIVEPTEVDMVSGVFLFCLKSDFEKLNGFDENFFFYGEETDFCLRFKKGLGRVIYFPKTKIIHYGSSNEKKAFWFKYKNLAISKIKYYKKHYTGVEFFIILLLHYIGYVLRFFVHGIAAILTLDTNRFRKAFYFLKAFFIYPNN